jgi:hypothetical protein
MSEKKTAREELSDRISATFEEKMNILKKLPQRDQLRLIQIECQMENMASGFDYTDAQLEWDRADGMKRCPITYTDEEIEANVKKPLTKLCIEKDCPEYKGCWATRQLEAPKLMVVSASNVKDADPHPKFERS